MEISGLGFSKRVRFVLFRGVEVFSFGLVQLNAVRLEPRAGFSALGELLNPRPSPYQGDALHCLYSIYQAEPPGHAVEGCRDQALYELLR